MANRPSRIVVIDDDEEVVRTCRELLESELGSEVLVCTNGDQGYEFVREHRPDLVLLDLQMDGKPTGWNIFELLNYDAETRDIPVIVCTGTVGEIENLPMLELFGVPVLAKPIDVARLLELVREALRGALGADCGRGR